MCAGLGTVVPVVDNKMFVLLPSREEKNRLRNEKSRKNLENQKH